MRLAASSCNPAWHKSSTIVSNYLLCSCHNAVRNLQLQSRIAGVYCPQPCQCVLSQPVEQERRTKSTSVRAALTMGTISRCSDSLTFWRFLCESELSLQSCCTFCQQLSPIEPCTAETETLLGRPRPPLYPKKHRVSRPRVFSSLNSRVPDLLLYLMMMWLP